jgi:hypothetical protein
LGTVAKKGRDTMRQEVKDNRENRAVNVGYIQQALQSTLTIWFVLTAVIIAAFGLSESLRVAGVFRADNVLITFIVSLILILLVLLLLPGSLLTLKEEQKDNVRKRYILHALQSLSVMWASLALVIAVAIGLFSVLRVTGVSGNNNLLVTFILSLALSLLALWLLPKSFLTLKEEQKDDKQ